MLTTFDKAIAAGLVGLLVSLANQFGLALDPAVKDALAVILGALAVYFVPNKEG